MHGSGLLPFGQAVLQKSWQGNGQEKTVKWQQKCKKMGEKKAIIIIRKAVKDAVQDPFSKHLSPLPRVNALIIKGLKNRSDSDRCFATFYFSLPFITAAQWEVMLRKSAMTWLSNKFMLTKTWRSGRCLSSWQKVGEKFCGMENSLEFCCGINNLQNFVFPSGQRPLVPTF